MAATGQDWEMFYTTVSRSGGPLESQHFSLAVGSGTTYCRRLAPQFVDCAASRLSNPTQILLAACVSYRSAITALGLIGNEGRTLAALDRLAVEGIAGGPVARR
jgi:hypothetical protein